MILHAYFARRFVQSIALVTGVFLTLLMLIDFIEQLRRFEGVDVSIGQLAEITLLNLPGGTREILPLIVILSTIVLFVGLARTSELIVTRAAGRSGFRVLVAPLAVALVLGIFSVTTLNPIVAATSNKSIQLTETYRSGSSAALSISGEGLWLRQGSPEGQTVIYAGRYSADAAVLYDVTFLTYAATGGPVQRIEAGSARLENGEWSLRVAKVWPLADNRTAETEAVRHDTLRIPSTLTEERIRDSLGTPFGISVWDLPATIRQLAQAGFSVKRHEVWFQVELARPLFLLAMVLVAAAFTMRHTRSGGTGAAVLMAVLLGFGLYFIRNFAQILGENGQIPAMLAAWAPPAASILLAVGLLLHTEDG